MIDFAINNKGDLTFDRYSPINIFKLSFRTTKYPIFQIQFLQEDQHIERDIKDNCFVVKFITTNLNDKKHKQNKAIHNLDELRQRVMIALRTEENELTDSNLLGSKLYIYKHKDILSLDVQQGIIDTITNYLNNMLDGIYNIEVKVIPKKIDNPFFCQNLSIYIFLNDELLYDFLF